MLSKYANSIGLIGDKFGPITKSRKVIINKSTSSNKSHCEAMLVSLYVAYNDQRCIVVADCRSCEVCQKRAPTTFRDRVPIEGGVSAVEPVFSYFYVDALGPLFNHEVEYNYCIVFLSQTLSAGQCLHHLPKASTYSSYQLRKRQHSIPASHCSIFAV